MGQTVRCINDRLREHRAALSSFPSGYLEIHCSRCDRTTEFGRAKVLGRLEVRWRRKLPTFHIKKEGNGCVSALSLVLLDDQFAFLEARGV